MSFVLPDNSQSTIVISENQLSLGVANQPGESIVIAMAIPGPIGPRGQSLSVDATGLLSERDAHDGEPAGFSFFATDEGLLYFREGSFGGWTPGIPFGRGDPGEPGKNIELRANSTHIQWRVEGGTWADLVALSDLEGEPGADGKSVSMQKGATHIQWRLGTDAWQDLIALSDMKGATGDDGKSVELRRQGANVEWRQEGGTWSTLFPLEDIKGDPGQDGTGTGDVVGPGSSVASGAVVVWGDTTGTHVVASSLSGLVKLTSGVPSAAVAGTDFVAPEAGKGLSEENFTTALLGKVNDAYGWGDHAQAGYLTQHQSLAGLVPNTREVNGKALSTDVTLAPSDVGAIPEPASDGTSGQVLMTGGDGTRYWGTVSGGGGGSGTVTSVQVSVPTGFKVSGGPITSSGTLAITFDTGYELPTTTKQGQWDSAYGWGDHSSAGYVPSARTINSKALTGNISLDATDVGARADNWVPSWSDVSGKPAVIAAGEDQATARAAIGAGTSNLALGSTSTTAMPGDTPIPSVAADVGAIPEPDTEGTSGQVLMTDGDGARYWGTVAGGGGGSGTVTSVGMSAPTGFKVTGSPVTSSGTLALAFDTGYALPTTTKQGEWDAAYGWGDHSAAGYLTSHQSLDGYVPTSRTVNAKPLTGNITLDASDVGARADNWNPAWGDVTGKPAVIAAGATQADARAAIGAGTSNLALGSTSSTAMPGDTAIPSSPGDIGAATATQGTQGATAYSWGNHASAGYATETWVNNKGYLTSHQDISGLVPKTTTVNSKALSGNITLSAADVGAIAEPASDGTNGQALVTDGAGGRSWQTIGGGSGPALSNADPAALGTKAPGTSVDASRADHVHQMPSAADVGARADNWVPSWSDVTGKPTVIAAGATQAAARSAIGAGSGDGTVTSIGLSVPTGLAVSGSPVTTSGTLAVSLQSGYSIPTTTKQGNWDTAYGWGDHASAGYVPNSRTINSKALTGNISLTPADVGAIAEPASDGTSGQVLTTDGSGGRSWTTVSGGGGGTVTSVGVSVPSGLTVSGSPVTTSGTIAINYDTGYAIPTTAKQSNWDTAYGWGNHASAGYVPGTRTVNSKALSSDISLTASDVGARADNWVPSWTDVSSKPAVIAAGADKAAARSAIDAGTGNGTVTSVGLSVPTGLSVSGSPVTTSGTLTLAYDTGYAIPTTSKQANWDTAYSWGDHSTAGYLTSHQDISGLLPKSGGTMTGAITFAGAQTWPTFNQNTTGSAATLTTARTLTIGSTGKTFNGSANVSWTLAEIGAAPANATLTDAAGASTLPSTSSSTLASLLQTVRNCLRWLIENMVPTSRTVNSKALSSDITLSAADVGAIAEPGSDGTNGQVLTTNGTGGRSWTTVSGGASFWTSVDAHGAVGNGTTDDTLAIRAAVTAAGAHGTLVFTPGKTYLVSGTIELLEQQVVIGYGATIKRCNQITATTTGSISTGSGSVTVGVSSVGGLKVGMDVAVFSGGTFDIHQHAILSISGSNVTLGTAFTTGFASGATIITAFRTMYAPDGGKVYGLTFDGNRANNTSFGRWEIHQAIYVLGLGSVVQDCTFNNEVSEGVYAAGSGVAVHNNRITNCGGNGIHMSGCTGAKVTNNYVYNANLASTGHEDGLICFSDLTEYALVANNYLDTGICGVSSIDTDGNSNVVITGNIIKNCTAYGIEGDVPSDQGLVGKLTITGNILEDCVVVKLAHGTRSSSKGVVNCVFASNLLKNTKLSVVKATGISVASNVIDLRGNTTSVVVNIEDADVVMSSNQIMGGRYGLYASGGCVLTMSANFFLNQYTYAASILDVTGGGAIVGNTIKVESGFSTASSYEGIKCAEGSVVSDNILEIATTSSEYAITCPSASSSTPGAIVKNNIIRSANLAGAIRMWGGSYNNFVVGNYTQQSISSPGSYNTSAGNYTIK